MLSEFRYQLVEGTLKRRRNSRNPIHEYYTNTKAHNLK